MRTTMDGAGRIVVPKAMREAIGLAAGEVDIVVSGAGLVIEAPASGLVERHGELELAATGEPVTPEQIREARLAAQR